MVKNRVLIVSLYHLERNPGIVEIFEEYFESITGLRDNCINVRKYIPEYGAVLIAIGLNNDNLIRMLKKFYNETSCVFIEDCLVPNLLYKAGIERAISDIETYVRNYLSILTLPEHYPNLCQPCNYI